ncbi:MULTISPECIES: non-heme iron oxygenase ferredoxin subunit [unclassified Thioalkalivibrio]|uniref:non-heme iron oxygenase ferredoxin subunit n=1 Tax=unclassified Thioalkalivibrio TaxID=2621013 RepID=UPI000195A4B8|nr:MULTISPECIES: non-heme iron oxygenase ferredoxin subunit [unclassified Thioalkalivibrio]ADC72083.1 Rieske (2Fe-2S) iron-sulphur domain protein [Thioalkalivibrio sp. K90mix]
MSEWIDVAPVDSIADGEHRLVDTAGTEVAIFNLDGEFFAVENLCTHEEVPIADGELDDDCITCPLHEAQFCLRTGEVMEPPAEDPLTRFPTRVHGGMVQVGSEPLDD